MPLPTTMLNRTFIGAVEFAEAVGIPLRTVQRWCAQGHIPAARRGPKSKLWFVNLRKIREQRENEINEFILDAQVAELRKVG